MPGPPPEPHYNGLTSDPGPGEFLNRECVKDFARAGVHLIAVGGGVGSE